MGADRAPHAGTKAFGSAARDRAAGRAGCDFAYRADRLSVAHAAKGLSSVYHVQGYFYDWRDDGLFALLRQAREAAGREASPSAGVIDSQSAKSTESGGPRGGACPRARQSRDPGDAGKKVKGRKRRVSRTHRPIKEEVWSRTRDEGWPLEVGNQVQASN